MIHGRHFGGYTDLVMICVHFMLILKVKKEVDAKGWPSLSHQAGPIWAHKGPYGRIRAHMGPIYRMGQGVGGMA